MAVEITIIDGDKDLAAAKEAVSIRKVIKDDIKRLRALGATSFEGIIEVGVKIVSLDVDG